MEFEINVRNVKFIIDAEDQEAAVDIVDDILNENAYDWGSVEVL